jgi:hypothetical protein
MFLCSVSSGGPGDECTLGGLLSLNGVAHPMTVTIVDLQGWPHQELDFTIECSGNHDCSGLLCARGRWGDGARTEHHLALCAPHVDCRRKKPSQYALLFSAFLVVAEQRITANADVARARPSRG